MAGVINIVVAILLYTAAGLHTTSGQGMSTQLGIAAQMVTHCMSRTLRNYTSNIPNTVTSLHVCHQ